MTEWSKKDEQLAKSNTWPCVIILDEDDQPMCTLRESLVRWRKYFDNVLNVSREIQRCYGI